MIALPDERRIACIIMGDIFGYLTAEDRRPGGIAPLDCDFLSGLPKNEAPRAYLEKFTRPDGTIGMVERQTQGSLLLPAHLAKGGMALASEMTLWSGSEDAEGGHTPGLAAAHLYRVENGTKRGLDRIPRSQWTQKEVGAWREYSFRIRKVFKTWAGLGLVDPRPILFEAPMPLGPDELPRVVRPTWKLLDLVRAVIPGTPWANRPRSILHELDEHERLQQPQYAQESYAKEAGGSVAAPLTTEAPETSKEETPCPDSSSCASPALPSSSRTTPTGGI